MKYLFFDTETTGLSKTANLVSIAWLMANENGLIIHSEYHIIKPEGWIIPEDSIKIHKITQIHAEKYGADLREVIDRFLWYVNQADVLVAHNIQFDQKIINYALKYVLGKSLLLEDYKKRMLPIKGRYAYTISYSKPTFSFPTIDIVIISPFIFDANLNGYVKNEENCFYCLLYDKETDIIIGEIVRVYRDWDWKNEDLEEALRPQWREPV